MTTLRGHAGTVWALGLSGDGRRLASGELDGTVKLWETSSGAAVSTFRTDRSYERVDITGLTGITGGQREAMVALGAVDRGASTQIRH